MTQRMSMIGAGTIGASWAAYFLARGLASAPTIRRPAARPLPAASSTTPGRRWKNSLWCSRREPAAPGIFRQAGGGREGAEFVQESGPEREDLKIELFAELDAALPQPMVIASSSSGLLISRITAKCKHPERCVIGHPFNPPHLIPLVEVVGGGKTSAEAIAAAMDFYRALGKHPIHIKKEVRGHVANRLQAALWREAVHLVVEGVVSVADADAAIAYGPGLRWALMGPHLTFHLAGGEGGMANFMEHLAGDPELDGRSRPSAADRRRCKR